MPTRVLTFLALLPIWATGAAQVQSRQGADSAADFDGTFALAAPEQVGMDSGKLLTLTDWVRDNPARIYSLLISRHGKLVYELYTSGIERDQAHYVMSVTKTFVSALVGIAVGDKVLPAAEAPVTKVLPRRLFAGDQDFARFSGLTLREVMGMAALDAPVPPHDLSPAAEQRQQAFWSAQNRVSFALTQALLPEEPAPFQYNDITPMLAVGMLQYAAGTSAFEYAQQHLFAPLGFRNAEWMHQDATGIDNGGYGLRVRPIDMQKFGVLYLRRGNWEGKQLLAKSWVDLSFTPWNRSQAGFAEPDYGWFWWTRREANWTRHEANGWKGQRIAVLPEPGVVVTMTACIEDGSEDQVFRTIVNDLLPPTVRNSSGAALQPARTAHEQLQQRLQQARDWQRIDSVVEPRMLPGAAAKESRKPFTDAESPRRGQ